MKRSMQWIVAIVLFIAAQPVLAERLEIGVALTPTVLQDTSYEAFSDNNLRNIRVGGDIRSEVVNLSGFRLVPLIGYRGALDKGEPYFIVNTELALHDLFAGLRVRKGILSWLLAFVEVNGGVLWAKMHGSPYDDDSIGYGDLGARQSYSDLRYTWSVGGLGGVELQLPKSWLRSRGVNKFGFAAEVAAGYVRRGDIEFEPSLESGDENAIVAETRPWGQVNLSGWMIQVAASFRFF